jgi:hypothetical protein
VCAARLLSVSTRSISLTLPADFTEHFANTAILAQDLAHRQHRFLPGQLPLSHSVVQNNVSCAQVQAMVRGDIDELVAVTANDRRHASILRSEDVDGVGGMSKGGQTLGALKDFDAHRGGFGE